MTLQALPTLVSVPDVLTINTGTFNNGAIASTTAKVACVFQVPASGSLTDITFRTGTVTVTADVSVRIETVGTDGLPTGTLIGTSADGAVTSPASNTTYTVTLNAAQAVTQAQLAAIVLACPSGSPNITISRFATQQATAFPYCVTATTGAYTKSGGSSGVHALKISGSWKVPFGLTGAHTLATSTFSSSSSPNERGLKFSLPVKATLAGVWLLQASDGTPTCDVNLYDASNNVLATASYLGAQTGGSSTSPVYLLFSTPYTLNASTTARIAIKPTTTTAKNYRTLDVSSNTYSAALPGGGTFQRTTRTGAGAWTDTDTGVDAMGLLISHVNAATGQYQVKTVGGWVDIA